MADIVFSVAIGGQEMSRQAEFLIRSIRRHHRDVRVFAFATTGEIQDIPDGRLERIRELATVVVDQMPISDYPISAKVAAMKYAVEHSSAQYYISLDADIILLRSFEKYLAQSNEAEIHMKPVDGVSSYWERDESASEWKRLASEFGYDTPSKTVKSTVRNEPIFPYYNAGVVIAENADFVHDWFDLTCGVYECVKGNDYSFFSDQVALGFLSQKYSVRELSEMENYPLPHYDKIPSNVVVLHHHGFGHLAEISDGRVISKLQENGVWDDILRPPQMKYYTRKAIRSVQNHLPI